MVHPKMTNLSSLTRPQVSVRVSFFCWTKNIF